jgi:hypothetical protein
MVRKTIVVSTLSVFVTLAAAILVWASSQRTQVVAVDKSETPSIGRCPSCTTDAALRSHILSAVPGLESNLRSKPLDALIQLRDWVAQTLNTGDLETYEGFEKLRLNPATPVATLFQFLDQQKGGPFCGGSAVFFGKILSLFGIPNVELNVGVEKTSYSHVLNVTAVRDGSSWRYYPVDAWFAASLTSSEGRLLDIEEVAVRMRESNFKDISVQFTKILERRHIVFAKEVAKINMPHDFKERCSQEMIGSEPGYVCPFAVDFIDYFAPEKYEEAGVKEPSFRSLPNGSALVYASMISTKVLGMSSGFGKNMKADFCSKIKRVGLCDESNSACQKLCG